MPPKYICITDDFYTDNKADAMDHIDMHPRHEIVEIVRDNQGTIETRLIKVVSEKSLE